MIGHSDGAGGRQAPTPQAGQPQVPIWPWKVSSDFGAVRRSPADGACGSSGNYPCTHYGIDVVGAPGTTVVAPEAGSVVQMASGSSSPWGGYGPWLIVIKGRSGLYHLLAHLDPTTKNMAIVGQSVDAGQPVGTVSSAWHTHWEVRRKVVPDFSAGEHNNTNNIDPLQWLETAPRKSVGGWILAGIAGTIFGAWISVSRRG